MHNFAAEESKRALSPILVAVAGLCISLMPKVYAASDSAPCSTNTESRQLDYWLGDWTIAGPGSSPSASSRVHLALDACLVIEDWDGGRGHKGENVFGYSADDNSWHGMFADNQGRVHVFVDGKVVSGSAEFSGPSRGPGGETVLNRIRIVRISPDKVEQIWEKSSDHGSTWTKEFSGEYARKKS
jgi:hypothetical protein